MLKAMTIKELRLYLVNKDTTFLLFSLPLLVFFVLSVSVSDVEKEPVIAIYAGNSSYLLDDVDEGDYINVSSRAEVKELAEQGKIAAGIVIEERKEEVTAEIFLDTSLVDDVASTTKSVRTIADKVGVAFSSRKLDEMWEKLDNADATLSESRAELVKVKDDTKSSKEDLQETLDKLKVEDFAELEEKIEEQNSTISSMEGSVAEIKNETASFDEASDTLTSSIASFDESDAQIAAISNSLEETNQTLDEFDSELVLFKQELNDNYDELEGQKTGGPGDAIIEEKQAQILEQIDRIDSIQQNLTEMGEELGGMGDDIEEIRSDLSETKSSLEASSSDISSTSESIESEMDGILADIDEAQDSFDDIHASIRDIRGRVDETRAMIETSVGMLDGVAVTVEESEASIDEFHSKLEEVKAGGSASYTDALEVETHNLFGDVSVQQIAFQDITALTIFLGSLLVSAILGVREKSSGVQIRFMHSQVNAIYIALGKLMGDIVMTSVIPVFLIILSKYALDVKIAAPVHELIGLSLLAVGVFVSVGALISLFVNTQSSGVLSCLVFGIPSVMISGMTIPSSAMPVIVERLSLLTPLTTFYVAFQDLTIKGYLTKISTAGLVFMLYHIFFLQAIYVILFRNLEVD